MALPGLTQPGSCMAWLGLGCDNFSSDLDWLKQVELTLGLVQRQMRRIVNLIIAKLKSKRTRKLELENVLIIANYQIRGVNKMYK